MAFNFPTSPTVGLVYTGPNNIQYTWDGVTWIGGAVSGGAAASANQILYRDSTNNSVGSNSLTFDSTRAKIGTGPSIANSSEARLDVRALPGSPTPVGIGGTSLFLSNNTNSTLAVKHSTDGGLDNVYGTGTTPRWWIQDKEAMAIHATTGSLHLNNDLILTAIAGQTGSPRLAEIVWGGHGYPEKHRIWPTDDGLAYQKDANAAGVAGLLLHTGNLVIGIQRIQAIDTTPYVPGGQVWDWSKNYFDIFPPEGYTINDLKAYIPSISQIIYEGTVNQDDVTICTGEILLAAGRLRIWVGNTEMREPGIANVLTVWRR